MAQLTTEKSVEPFARLWELEKIHIFSQATWNLGERYQTVIIQQFRKAKAVALQRLLGFS